MTDSNERFNKSVDELTMDALKNTDYVQQFFNNAFLFTKIIFNWKYTSLLTQFYKNIY